MNSINIQNIISSAIGAFQNLQPDSMMYSDQSIVAQVERYYGVRGLQRRRPKISYRQVTVDHNREVHYCAAKLENKDTAVLYEQQSFLVLQRAQLAVCTSSVPNWSSHNIRIQIQSLTGLYCGHHKMQTSNHCRHIPLIKKHPMGASGTP